MFNEYAKRLKWKIELKELEAKHADNSSVAEIQAREAELIFKALNKREKIIALDQRYKQLSSLEFAKAIEKFSATSPDLAFIIGGSHGLTDDALKKASFGISLGAMTYPHMLVRVMLAEQLYRAYSIINHHPYHK